MKYIRTKNGIEENNSALTMVVSPEAIEELKENFNEYVKVIIDQADTIEELCDELVIKYKGISTPNVISRYLGDLYLTQSQKDAFEKGECDFVYGAIWTDKGLIYVAKMNDKGELCLI